MVYFHCLPFNAMWHFLCSCSVFFFISSFSLLLVGVLFHMSVLITVSWRFFHMSVLIAVSWRFFFICPFSFLLVGVLFHKSVLIAVSWLFSYVRFHLQLERILICPFSLLLVRVLFHIFVYFAICPCFFHMSVFTTISWPFFICPFSFSAFYSVCPCSVLFFMCSFSLLLVRVLFLCFSSISFSYVRIHCC